MKWIIAALLSLVSLPCVGQVEASRRHNELTPEQYKFGPMTPIAPFNSAPNHTTATTAQIQPSSMITSSNTCASTGNFTVLAQTSPAATFSVSGNVCTVATGSSGGTYIIGDSGSSFTGPYAFISVGINQVGSYEFAPVISNATGTMYLMADLFNSTSCNLVIFSASAFHNLSLNSCTAPGVNGFVGLSLVGNSACMWISTNGTAWTKAGCASTASFYNFQTTGNMTGLKAGVRLTATSTTWKFSNLVSGGFGAVGVRDISLVTYADGRPYMQGSLAYFTASSCDPTAVCYDGVYSYDVNSTLLTQLGAIFNVRSGASQTDQASHLVYDPGNNNYRYMAGGWGTSSTPPTFYGAWSRGTFDPLAGGVGLVNASTQMSFVGASVNWDTHFACSQWNYSAGTCGNWISANANTNGFQGLSTSTSDPSVNTWSNSRISVTFAEGDRVLRTASGSGGVNYEFVYASRPIENTSAPTVNTTNLGSVGTITAQIPGGADNPPHPQMFSYGNNEYLITFNDVQWGTVVATMGNWLVASTPKYSAQTNYPQFVTGTSNFTSGSTANVVSSSIAVASGDIVIGYCRGGTTSVASVVFSSSVSIGTFLSPGFDLITTGSGVGYGQAFYLFANASGSPTFTCTPNASSTFQGVTVQVWHPGFATTVDFTGLANQTGSSNALYTSPSFSTTAKGLIVVCADGLFAAGHFVPGAIGPFSAGEGSGLTTGAAVCTGTATSAAQTTITANIGTTSGNSAQWDGAILSFK